MNEMHIIVLIKEVPETEYLEILPYANRMYKYA